MYYKKSQRRLLKGAAIMLLTILLALSSLNLFSGKQAVKGLDALASSGSIGKIDDSTLKSLGFSTDSAGIKKFMDEAVQPLGDKPVAVLPVAELTVRDRNGFHLYDYNGETVEQINLQTAATATNSSVKIDSDGNSARSVAFNPVGFNTATKTGTVKKEYIAEISAWRTGSVTNFALSIYDGKTRSRMALHTFGNIEMHFEPTQIGALLSVTAGDYDGDGKEEVAVYDPSTSLGNSGNVVIFNVEVSAQGTVSLSADRKIYIGRSYANRYIQNVVGTSNTDPAAVNAVIAPAMRLTTSVKGLTGSGYSNHWADRARDHVNHFASVSLANVSKTMDGADDLAVAVSVTRYADERDYAIHDWQGSKKNTAYLSTLINPLDPVAANRTIQTAPLWDNWDTDYKKAGWYEDNERMLFPGVTAGDIDGDGYPELVVAGYRLDHANENQKDGWKLDADRFLITYFDYTVKKENTSIVRNYERNGLMQWVSMKTGDTPGSTICEAVKMSNGNSDGDNMLEPIHPAIFAEYGAGTSEFGYSTPQSIFANGMVLSLKSPDTATEGYSGYEKFPDSLKDVNFATNTKTQNGFRIRYAFPLNSAETNDYGGFVGTTVNRRAISEVVVGNFNADPNGREQVFFTYTMQNKMFMSRYSSVLCTLSRPETSWHTDMRRISNNDDSKVCATLSAPDVDNDTTLVRPKGKTPDFYFSDPEITAILEAAPYFAELDGDGPSTSISISQGSGTDNTHGISMSASIEIGGKFEIQAGAGLIASASTTVFEFEAMAGITASAGYEHTVSSMTTVSKTFTATTSHTVVLGMTPRIRYYYESFDPKTGSWEDMIVNVPRQPQLNQITVDVYDRVARANGWNTIGENIIVSTAGNPKTYRSIAPHSTWSINGTTTDNPDTNWTTVGITGSETNDFGREMSWSNTATWATSLTASVGMTVTGFKMNVAGSVDYTGSSSNVNVKGVTYAGTVPGVPNGKETDFNFKWKFGTWLVDLKNPGNTDLELKNGVVSFDDDYKGNPCVVLGYLVKDCISPPAAPSVWVTDVGTDSLKINWNAVPGADSYQLLLKSGDSYESVNGFLSAWNGNSFSFLHSGLDPNYIYEYAIRSVKGGVSGLDNKFSVRTLPSGKSVQVFIDGQNVMPGQTAVFTAEVSGGTATTYEWMKYTSSGWEIIPDENSARLEIPNAGLENNGEKYQCIATVPFTFSYKIYSNVAVLNVSKKATKITGFEYTMGTSTGGQNNELHGWTNRYVTQTVKQNVTVSKTLTATCNGITDTVYTVVYKNSNYLLLDSQNNYYIFDELATAVSERGSKVTLTLTGTLKAVRSMKIFGYTVYQYTENSATLTLPFNPELLEPYVFTATEEIDVETAVLEGGDEIKLYSAVQDLNGVSIGSVRISYTITNADTNAAYTVSGDSGSYASWTAPTSGRYIIQAKYLGSDFYEQCVSDHLLYYFAHAQEESYLTALGSSNIDFGGKSYYFINFCEYSKEPVSLLYNLIDYSVKAKPSASNGTLFTTENNTLWFTPDAAGSYTLSFKYTKNGTVYEIIKEVTVHPKNVEISISSDKTVNKNDADANAFDNLLEELYEGIDISGFIGDATALKNALTVLIDGTNVAADLVSLPAGTYYITVSLDANLSQELIDLLKNYNISFYSKVLLITPAVPAPTGAIVRNAKSWTGYSEDTVYGFFRNSDSISITASDGVNSITSVQYIISQTNYTLHDIAAVSAWQTYGAAFTVNAKGSVFVYAKITSSTGLITYLRTQRLVYYVNSAEKTILPAEYVKASDQTKEIEVTLNGNTVRELSCSLTVLAEGTDYIVNNVTGKIYLSPAYLNTLTAGTYTFTVKYDPRGVAYQDIAVNDVPASTTFSVTVSKAAPKVLWPSGIAAVYGQTLSDISLAGFSNTPAGTFSWSNENNSVGSVGPQTHSLIFTPADPDTYFTATNTITVFVGKLAQSAPVGLQFISASPTHIILNKISGAEYSTDGENWQESAVFTGLDSNTGYTVYVRMKESATHNASDMVSINVSTTLASLTGTVSIMGDPVFGQMLTSRLDWIGASPAAPLGAISYQWLADGIAIENATSATYVLTFNEVGKTITVSVSASGCFGAVASAPTKTVKLAVISSASIFITTPVGGATASYTATGTGNFTFASRGADTQNVDWSPMLDSSAKFWYGFAYDVTATIIPNEGYTFTGLETVTVNGYTATFAPTSNNPTTITLTYKFPATDSSTIVSIEFVSGQGPNLSYTHGDILNLTNVKVKLTYINNSEKTISFNDFAANNIVFNFPNGTVINRSMHNGRIIKVSCGDVYAESESLAVEQAIYTPAIPVVNGKFMYGNLLTKWTFGHDEKGEWRWLSPQTTPVVKNELINGYEASYYLTDSNYKLQGDNDPIRFIISVIPLNSTVTPLFDANATVYDGSALPSITTSVGDTSGFISWDKSFASVFTSTYFWTFTPADSNNSVVTGYQNFDVYYDNVNSLTIEKQPGKKVYSAFESFDTSGLYVKLNYNSGREDYLNLANPTLYTLEYQDEAECFLAGHTYITLKFERISINIAVTVNKIKVILPIPLYTVFEYDSYEKTISLSSSGPYTISNDLKGTDAGDYFFIVELDDLDNYIWANDYQYSLVYAWTINKAPSSNISSPALASKTENSITISAVTLGQEDEGREVEYAISKSAITPQTDWQSGLVFSGLDSGTNYYVFARIKGTDDYLSGAVSASMFTTDVTITDIPEGCKSQLASENMSLISLLALTLGGLMFILKKRSKRSA